MFDSRRFILASQSPRRRELLSALGIDFKVEKGNDVPENYPDSLAPAEIPEYLSRRKSEAFGRPLASDEILITADTLVFLDDRIMGKPADREDAFGMLRSLSGRTHTVRTGVSLRTSCGITSFTESSDVTFRELSDSEINYYLDAFSPFDKAGSYGIQEWIGYSAISCIRGSYTNIVGLPTSRIFEELVRLVSE